MFCSSKAGNGRFDIERTSEQETVRLLAKYLDHLTKFNTEQHRSSVATINHGVASDKPQDGVVGSMEGLVTHHRQALSRFNARSIPTIDVHAYLSRILRYAHCGSECFLALLVYLQRMSGPTSRLSSQLNAVKRRFGIDQQQNSSSSSSSEYIVVHPYNIHRLIITGMMLAVKFSSDVFYTNKHMAKVGGLPVEELNQLEIEFFVFNGFSLAVSNDELQLMGDLLLMFDGSDTELDDPLLAVHSSDSFCTDATAAEESIISNIPHFTSIPSFLTVNSHSDSTNSINTVSQPINTVSHSINGIDGFQALRDATRLAKKSRTVSFPAYIPTSITVQPMAHSSIDVTRWRQSRQSGGKRAAAMYASRRMTLPMHRLQHRSRQCHRSNPVRIKKRVELKRVDRNPNGRKCCCGCMD